LNKTSFGEESPNVIHLLREGGYFEYKLDVWGLLKGSVDSQLVFITERSGYVSSGEAIVLWSVGYTPKPGEVVMKTMEIF
jgi:hypothetical protein